MANEKQFGIKEVLNLTVFDYTTGNQLFYLPYCTETNVSTTAERLEIAGGQGFYNLTAWDYGKKMMSKINVPLVDLSLLAHLSGTTLATGATTAHTDEVLITAGATPTVTLSSTPLAGTIKVSLMNSEYDLGTVQTAGTPASTPNTYSLSSTTLTLNGTSAPAGTRVLVSYDYTTAATSQLITVLANQFLDFTRITGQGLWRNVISGDDEIVSFDLKKCKFKPNFTLTQSSKDATNLELDVDLFYVQSGANKIYANIVKV